MFSEVFRELSEDGAHVIDTLSEVRRQFEKYLFRKRFFQWSHVPHHCFAPSKDVALVQCFGQFHSLAHCTER